MFSSFWIWAASRLSPHLSRDAMRSSRPMTGISPKSSTAQVPAIRQVVNPLVTVHGGNMEEKMRWKSWMIHEFKKLSACFIDWTAFDQEFGGLQHPVRKEDSLFIAGAFSWFRNLSHTEACHTSRSCCDNRVSWLAADLQHMSLWIKIPTTCFMLHTATTTVLTSRPKGIQLCNDRMKNGTIYIQSWYYIDVILDIIEKYRCIWHACR